MEEQEKNIEVRLARCMNIEALRDVFSLEELLALTGDGLLQKWLVSRLLEPQAKMLDGDIRARGRDALLLRLCEALSVDVLGLPDDEAALITAALHREHSRTQREHECGTDGIIVTNQEELIEALADEDVHKVYLYHGIFSIPLQRGHITYDGRDNALIEIQAQGDDVLDFDGSEVYFYNLTLVFHFVEAQQVRIAHSSQNHNHVIFLRADRISWDSDIFPHEAMDLLTGRMPFETAEHFAERAKRVRGIIVGKTYLTDTDYDIGHQAFFLHPVFGITFIEAIRRYVRGARLVFPIDAEEAAHLYESERAQLLYADFAADQDTAVIVCLYLHMDGGQGKIYPVHCLRNASSWSLSSRGGGYGLDLIAIDEQHRRSSNRE